MVLTDTFGKSVLLSPVINLTELEYMINDIETFIGGVTNEIDFAHSTLERLRARLTHVGLSSAYKFYNPEKNNDKVYKEGNRSVPEYAPPRNGIYDGRNDSIAMMVKEDTSSPIPEAVPVIDLQISVSYFFYLVFITQFHTLITFGYLIISYFVYMFQTKSHPIASSSTGPECLKLNKDDSGSNKIHHGPLDNLLPTEQDVPEIIKIIKACGKHTEMLMSVSSTGKNGEDGGGVYQTPRPAHIVNLMAKIYPHVCSVLDDYPNLGREQSVTMIDAGAGMHIPGVLFATLGGYHSIGLEIDETRCALAADFLHDMANYFPKCELSLFNRDFVKPGNWSNVVVFFFWDRVCANSILLLEKLVDAFSCSRLLIQFFSCEVFTDETAKGFYENVHRSMTHDVILIQSIAFARKRLRMMEDYFEITECDTIPFTFYKSDAKDTFHILRLKHKKNSSTGTSVGKSIVDESIEIFGNSSCRKSMLELSRRMWHSLCLKKSQRKSEKRKRECS